MFSSFHTPSRHYSSAPLLHYSIIRYSILLTFCTTLYTQVQYNHPELNWQTFETEHFEIHFYNDTEQTAREGASVAEQIYPYVTELYDYEPQEKTHIVFIDTDDISNGAAYYYDNKIFIWASPLDFELRGSHRWLQNVITHEFVHIVSIRKSMKAGMKIPGAYLQIIGYEDERRKDVLYGFPNTLVSYPLPGSVVPPWLAEGTAQYMYEGADWDNWDTHRDMILRDRVLNDNLLTFTEMNTFGKKGIGNESTYNAGYAMTRYIAAKYGADELKKILTELANPFQFSIDKAIEKAIGIRGSQLYRDFKAEIEERYSILTQTIRETEQKGRVLISDGTTNLHPIWAPDGKRFAYISNKENDYFAQTDLFVYDLESNEEEKITAGVSSAPTWHPDGNTLYYSKKPKRPDKHGSRYYDLFAYDFVSEKETRLTRGIRAYAPVFIPTDSSIAFIATKDGTQNLHQLDLNNKTIRQLSWFQDHKIIQTLNFDSANNRIIFGNTDHHFRNISYFSLNDSTFSDLLNNPLWDERDISTTNTGKLLYADDRSGIFNLFLVDPNTGEQGYVTNVLGGAFMPDVNQNGQVLFSLYENGKYNIGLVDTIILIDDEQVGYSPTYYSRNENLLSPINSKDTVSATGYSDNFPPMFILPKIMEDYGTIKPGLYFYSSEILDRLSLFGGGSVNQLKDLDLFFLFEFKRFYPTLFAEVYYLTRNINESYQYSVYPLDDNLKFRLILLQAGLRFPILGEHIIEVYTNWQRYRAFIKEKIVGKPQEAGIAYDYYRGLVTGIRWKTTAIKPRADGNINPSNGFKFNVDVSYEDNDFIDGLDLSEAGTLLEEFKPNNLTRVAFDGEMHWEIPKTNRWTLSTKTMLGWLSNTKADSFFNFFGGGLTGIQGYPYYSIEGNRMAVGELVFRLPIFREKHIPMGWFILQNSVFGVIYQAGDAWSSKFKLKRSIGIQCRFNGFSFYNFPTAIGLEIHRGLDRFANNSGENSIYYGDKNRFYFTLLFGF